MLWRHYLFNSQLLSRDDGSMLLVLPRECQDHAGVWRYLNKLVAEDNPDQRDAGV